MALLKLQPVESGQQAKALVGQLLGQWRQFCPVRLMSRPRFKPVGVGRTGYDGHVVQAARALRIGPPGVPGEQEIQAVGLPGF